MEIRSFFQEIGPELHAGPNFQTRPDPTRRPIHKGKTDRQTDRLTPGKTQLPWRRRPHNQSVHSSVKKRAELFTVRR